MDDGFGKWLGQQMTRCGFASNVDLEHQTGIGNTTISRWRNGTMAPSVEQLRKLEGPLRTPLLELLVRAGVLSSDEAKVPRDRLTQASEPDPVSVVQAVERDSTLMDDAKEHLVNQYELLRRLSDLTDSKTPRRPKTPAEPPQRPLRAVARPRPTRRDKQ
jgi:transcriptional regulator with XRE-family HTH domain